MTRFGSAEMAGRLLGLFQSAFSLALILAPVAAGLILETIGPRAVFYTGAGLMGLATALALGLGHVGLPVREGRVIKLGGEQGPRNLLERFHH